MEIKELRTQLEGVKSQATAILDEHKSASMSAEKRSELDALMTKASELRGQIEDATSLEEKKADLARLDSFLNDPVHRVPVGVGNGGDDTKSALMKAGWEVKNGMVHAPTSVKNVQTGDHSVELFPEEVLFGEMPEGKTEAAMMARGYYAQVRAAMQPEYRKAYAHWMANAIKMRSEGIAFAMLSSDEQKALSEGTDTAGGILVPPDTQAELLVRLPQFAIMRRYAQVVNTSRDVLKWPAVKANATSGSIYSSGFVGDWAGETPAFSDTDPAFQMLEIGIKKIRVATKLSNDFIADAVFNVLAWLARNGAENMGLVEDNGFIAGDGSALQPLGILNAGLTTVDVEGSTSNTISNTTSSTGSAPKLIDLEYALPSQYLQRATWLMRRSVEGKVRKLVDAQGRFLWPAASGSAFGGVARSIDNYPVENSEFMPADGTDANKVLLFGDLGSYIIGQRAQITSTILRERFADTDQTGIVLFERVGGALWNTDALRVGIV